MAALVVVGLLGGIVAGALHIFDGIFVALAIAPLGASVSAAILACLRNVDTGRPAIRALPG